MTETIADLLNAGTIICKHAANRERHILFARRNVPFDESDSGWEFACSPGGESDENYEVWALKHVLATDSTLQEHMTREYGTVLMRANQNELWQVSFDPQSAI